MLHPKQAMRLVLAWLLLMIVSAHANTPTADERAAIQAIIEAQLAAFARDDAEAAFALASRPIQEKFGDARSFMAMVKTAYPVVYRPASVAYLTPEGGDGRFTQQVHFIDEEGRHWLALYALIRLPDASWRINGCAIQAAPGEAT